jgi:hypothetical protein
MYLIQGTSAKSIVQLWDVRRDLDVIKRHTWIEGNSRKNRTWSSGKQVENKGAYSVLQVDYCA